MHFRKDGVDDIILSRGCFSFQYEMEIQRNKIFYLIKNIVWLEGLLHEKTGCQVLAINIVTGM